jgi:beta-lactamase regulating signal transducer with metallopeptidase domain
MTPAAWNVLSLQFKSTVVLLACGCAVGLMRRARAPAAARAWVWTTAFACLPLLFAMSRIFPEGIFTLSSPLSFGNFGTAGAAGHAQTGHQIWEFTEVSAWGWYAYWLVAGCLLSRLVVGRLLLVPLWEHSREAHDVLAPELVAQFKRHGVATRITTSRASPMTWGVLRPKLLWPQAAASWPASQCKMVALHELAHVRRGDAAFRILVAVICALWWFNPLVWLAAAKLRLEQERACDDAVLRTGSGAAEYARGLLNILASPRNTLIGSWSTAGALRPSEVESRLIDIVQTRPRAAASSGFLAGSGVLALTATLFLSGVSFHEALANEKRSMHRNRHRVIAARPVIPVRALPRLLPLHQAYPWRENAPVQAVPVVSPARRVPPEPAHPSG